MIIYDPKDPLSYLYDVDDGTITTFSHEFSHLKHSQSPPSSLWLTGTSENYLRLAFSSPNDYRYHVVAPVLSHIIGTNANSSLINGLGRYQGGPSSELAVVNVEYGKRYRLRLIAMSCDPSFAFSIDNHNLTIIEADGELTQPLLVDSLQILAGQRYSVVLVANQPVANYWLRALPSTPGLNFNNGQSSAILRYKGAPVADPTTKLGNSTMPLIENNLHALINPGAPGIPEYGKADINLKMVVNSTRGVYSINNASYVPPTVPVLLQILSGAQQATDLLPKGSVYVLGANKVVELTMLAPSIGGPVSFPHVHCVTHIS